MNPWQMAQQIKAELQAVVWPEGSGEVVFGTQSGVVAVFAGTPTEQQIPKAFPCCLVVMGDGEPDEDHPDFIRQTFRLLTGVLAGGDPMGEHTIIGGPSTNAGESSNRGIAEVTERVRAAIADLTGADGAHIQLVNTSIGTPFRAGTVGHMVFDEHTLTAACVSDLHYAAPQEIGHDGTTWTWQGAHCSSRFDFLQYRLYSKTTTNPVTPSSAAGVDTLVYTGAAATFTGAGTVGLTYTVFADYSSRNPTQSIPASSIEGSSDPEVGSYKAVT